MATIRQIISAVILLSQVTALAMPLSEYRKSYDTKGDFKREALKQQQELLTQLGFTGARLSAANKILGQIAVTQTPAPKSQNSIFFKELMEDSVDKYRRLTEYEKPLDVDPSLFSYEIQAKVIERKLNICTQSVENRRQQRDAQGHVVGSYNYLIERLYQEIVADELEAAKNPSRLKNQQAVPVGASSLQTFASQQIMLSPTGRALGQVTGVEFADGRLHRIIFGAGQTRLPVSASMLLTFATGDDNAFIDIQQCFLTVMASMRDTFSRELYKQRGNIFSRTARNIFTPDEDSEDKRHEALLKKYLDGVKSSGRSEKDYMTRMVKVLDKNIATVTPKLASAKRANETLKKLNEKELHGLLGLFIAGRGDDLLTPAEMGSFQTAARNRIGMTPRSDSTDEITTDIRYYTVQTKQLNRLADHLRLEEERHAFEAKELKQLELEAQ